MLPRKAVEKYTAADILQIWKIEFQKAFGTNYSTPSNPFPEMRLAKSLLEQYGIFHVLLSIPVAMKVGISSFADFYEQYSSLTPDTQYSELSFYVKKKADEQTKDKWRTLMLLESEWLQTPELKKKKEALEKELNDWLSGARK